MRNRLSGRGGMMSSLRESRSARFWPPLPRLVSVAAAGAGGAAWSAARAADAASRCGAGSGGACAAAGSAAGGAAGAGRADGAGCRAGASAGGAAAPAVLVWISSTSMGGAWTGPLPRPAHGSSSTAAAPAWRTTDTAKPSLFAPARTYRTSTPLCLAFSSGSTWIVMTRPSTSALRAASIRSQMAWASATRMSPGTTKWNSR